MPILNTIKTIAIGCLLIIMSACSHPQVDYDAIKIMALSNLSHPAPNALASGQPDKEELAQLAKFGVQHIVNLRPIAEQDWNEKAYVESLGMSYHSLPVAGAAGITPQNASALNDTLQQIGNEATLVHCASGNRVGGLVALNEGISGGKNIEEAIQEGKRWGLTRLEPMVRQQLLTHQAQQ